MGTCVLGAVPIITTSVQLVGGNTIDREEAQSLQWRDGIMGSFCYVRESEEQPGLCAAASLCVAAKPVCGRKRIGPGVVD